MLIYSSGFVGLDAWMGGILTAGILFKQHKDTSNSRNSKNQMIGEIAAIVTAICWALSSIFFTRAGEQVGSVVVNRMRLLFAVILLITAHFFLQGQVIPLNAGLDRWFWLGISGIVGLIIGDACLLQAYVLIGARIATLIMAVVPVISALLAWIFLDERLSIIEISGICLAVAGISIVILERSNPDNQPVNQRRYVLGILCAFGGALGQAGGLILAKKGLYNNFPALSGVVIRMLVAMSALWIGTFFLKQAGPTLQVVLEKRTALKYIIFGSVVGPFIGVWMSLVAIQNTYVGLASTLMALTPIVMLPIVRWVFKEQVSQRAVIGTLVSIIGVAIIYFAPGA
ncbi:MAG TPA: DMT family transporter [Anaerolineaceae bacterium]|nr:DMT family transporter [Anaerolineaceae bacterium]